MPRFKTSLLAACGLLVLAAVLGAIGPKRALAALGYTPVRDVDFAARQPLTVLLNANTSGGNGPVYTVPADKRLVIEFVSIQYFGRDVNVVQLQIWDAALTGFIGSFAFPLTPAVGGGSSLGFAGATKIYLTPATAGFAPGTALKLVGGSSTTEATFSGYLEPL